MMIRPFHNDVFEWTAETLFNIPAMYVSDGIDYDRLSSYLRLHSPILRSSLVLAFHDVLPVT